MSKKKVLVFKDNKHPRLLVEPSQELLDQFPVDQIVKGNMKFLKGLELHKLVLDSGIPRKATSDELEVILNEINYIRKDKDLVLKNMSRQDRGHIVVNVKDQLELVIREIGARESERMENILKRQGMYTLAILLSILAIVVR